MVTGGWPNSDRANPVRNGYRGGRTSKVSNNFYINKKPYRRGIFWPGFTSHLHPPLHIPFSLLSGHISDLNSSSLSDLNSLSLSDLILCHCHCHCLNTPGPHEPHWGPPRETSQESPTNIQPDPWATSGLDIFYATKLHVDGLHHNFDGLAHHFCWWAQDYPRGPQEVCILPTLWATRGLEGAGARGVGALTI